MGKVKKILLGIGAILGTLAACIFGYWKARKDLLSDGNGITDAEASAVRLESGNRAVERIAKESIDRLAEIAGRIDDAQKRASDIASENIRASGIAESAGSRIDEALAILDGIEARGSTPPK